MTNLDTDAKAPDNFLALDLTSVALLLDVDGTLIDIGPTPHDVHVPDELCRSLTRLADAAGGALALVSGRPIADLDRMFAPLRLSAIGGHGAETRVNGTKAVRAAPRLPERLRRGLSDALAAGVLIEDKGYSLALHYRAVPAQRENVQRLVAEACAAFPDEGLEVLPGKEMLEIRRRGVNKGEAVRALMTYAPFAGRVPAFIGDDVTDESVFAILPQLGGIGFSVGHHFAGLTAMFASPAHVRAALDELAERTGRGRP